MTAHEMRTLRATWAWLFALVALAGLAVWLSLLIAVAVVRLLDVGVPESWHWIFLGWLGLVAALLFGTLAFITSRPAGRTTAVTRIGLGVLGAVCIWLGLMVLLSWFYGAPILGLLLLVIGAGALYGLWRRRRGGGA